MSHNFYNNVVLDGQLICTKCTQCGCRDDDLARAEALCANPQQPAGKLHSTASAPLIYSKLYYLVPYSVPINFWPCFNLISPSFPRLCLAVGTAGEFFARFPPIILHAFVFYVHLIVFPTMLTCFLFFCRLFRRPIVVGRCCANYWWVLSLFFNKFGAISYLSLFPYDFSDIE